MKDEAFIYTFATRVGVFRIQPHKNKFGLFIDYTQGDWDLLTSCISVDDGVDYVEHQDTLLGWTILGWIGALIWAVIEEPKK